MARFTELFSEYLDNGGLLPSTQFALIAGFEDLFKERYCASEIGFETETIFALKLDMKAKLVMPLYAARVAAVDNAIGRLSNPLKTRTEQRGYGKQHSESENDGSNTELPINATTAEPSNTAHSEASADVDYHEDNFTYSDYITIDENLRIIDSLNESRKGLVEKCLDEFKNLFMAVYL